MNSTRLAVIGFIIAVIIAVYAFITQQQATDRARLAAFEATLADEGRVTALALMQEAIGTQVQAEAGQATARADSAVASTAQSEAEAAVVSAEAQANEAVTRNAQIAATSTAASETLQATSAAATKRLSTIQAQGTAAIATVQAELDAQATTQADTLNQLATATSQIDLADFARQSAEADRARALEQLWAVGTRQAETLDELATAQAIISGVTPTPIPTNAPPASPTLPSEATPVSGIATDGNTESLSNNFESNDKRMRLQYPGGWFAREVNTNFVTIVNDSILFDRGNQALASGQYEINVLASTRTDLGIPTAATAEEILLTFIDFFKSRDSTFQNGDPVALTLGSYAASRVPGNDSNNDLSVTLIDLGNDSVVLAFAYSTVGESDQFSTVLDTVLATVEFG
jgi:hypothetical protein